MALSQRLADKIEDIVLSSGYIEKFYDYYYNEPFKLEGDIKRVERMLTEIRRTTIFRDRQFNKGAGVLGRTIYEIFSAALEVAEKLVGTAYEDLERYYKTGTMEM